MITIWILKDDLDAFVTMLDNIDAHETNKLVWFTYKPFPETECIQMLIGYNEYKKLEDITI